MFLLSLSIYYARDSCKRWQENKDRLGLISRMTVKNFSSLFCFSFFFFCFLGVTGSVRLRQLKISRHYFVFFVFCFLSGSDQVCLDGTAENFSSLFCFFVVFFFFLLVKLGLLGKDSRIFLVTIMFFFLFSFLFSSRVFFPFFFFIYYTTRGIVVKSDKKK